MGPNFLLLKNITTNAESFQNFLETILTCFVTILAHLRFLNLKKQQQEQYF